MLTTLAIANYRSLRELILPLQRLNVITGANGSGKSSVYRALRLLAETAQGGLIPALAREGGLQSTLWAGPEAVSRAMLQGWHPVQGTRRAESTSLQLGFASDASSYLIDLGVPPKTDSAFGLDPVIKHESVWTGPFLRRGSQFAERSGAVVKLKDEGGAWRVLSAGMASFDSMLTQLGDMRDGVELLQLREQMRAWRFYDHFRTDAGAPARRAQIGTHTPVLSHDGHDLAAAIRTIMEIGDTEALDQAVDDAFPGATLEVDINDGRFELHMRQRGLLRPMRTSELSDGTLRYLLWIAALLSPRPPELLVLNEPETSLHPDLLAPLARLIGKAARQSQIIAVSHAQPLIEALEGQRGYQPFLLEKVLGATKVAGMGELDKPAWHWHLR